MNLRATAINVFDFFCIEVSEELLLYYDKAYNDYYIVADDDIYNSEKFDKSIGKSFDKFDISNIRFLSKKYLSSSDGFILIKTNEYSFNHTRSTIVNSNNNNSITPPIVSF